MTPTRIRTLLLLGGVTLVLGWATVSVVARLSQRLLPVPWTSAAALAIIALALLAWGLLAKPKLQRQPGRPRMDPIVATRTAALAMAASRTGAAVGGFYAGVALSLLDELDTQAGRQYAAAGAAAAVASLGLTVVGLWLESICRLKDGGEDKNGKRQGSGPGEATNTASRTGT